MATLKRFEDIEAWKRARELTRRVYELSHQGTFKRDFVLRDQIRRAAISIMSNIAEGFERDGTAEFIHFLSIAKGSTGEVESQLYVALDVCYVSAPEFQILKSACHEIRAILAGLIQYLRRCGIRGTKFK